MYGGCPKRSGMRKSVVWAIPVRFFCIGAPIMVARPVNEAGVEAAVAGNDLAKIVARNLSREDAVDRLRERRLEQRAECVTVT